MHIECCNRYHSIIIEATKQTGNRNLMLMNTALNTYLSE